MKREKWLSFGWALAMSLLLSLSGAGCLVTAFALTGVSMGTVALWCLGCSLGLCAWAVLEKNWLFYGTLALGGILLLVDGAFWDSVPALGGQVAAAWGLGDFVPKASPTGGLCLLAMVSSAAVCRCVCAHKSLWLGAVAAIPLLLCMPARHTAPDGVWLFAFLTGAGLLVLTQGLRRKLPVQGNRLAAMALLPAICLSAALYFAIPMDSYSMDEVSASVLLQIKNWFSGVQSPVDVGKPLKVGGGAVLLSAVGDRKESQRKALEVTWDRGGALYLRSCSYDTYFNNTWTNLAVPDSLNWPALSELEPAGELTVQTNGYLDMLLTPYYPMGGELEGVTRGISNYVDKRVYTYTVGVLPQSYILRQTPMPAQLNAYTQLPSQTMLWARGVLADILEDGQSVSQKAEAIKSYVSQCAEYTLTPGKMPSAATDFVRWFVEDNEKGYCVHFASAATVFLRAAGIPARYVTGYLFTAKPGQVTEVYGKNAHAWTEYWLPGVGWVVLEATPPGAVQAQLTVEEEVTSEPQVQEKETSFRLVLPGAWFWWSLLGAAVVATVAQWRLRVWLRRRKCHRGGINGRAVAWWAELMLFTGHLNRQPEEELLLLAEKAQFSQHVLEEAELAAIRSAAARALGELKQLSWYKRLYHRLILALY